MKPPSNPFSLYDLIGYLFTGFIFLYLINCFFIFGIIKFDSFTMFKGNGLAGSMEIKSFFYLVLSYLTGHVLSFLSSITIERYNIFIYGYPSNYLIKKEDDKSGWSKYYLCSYSKPKKALRIVLFIFLFPLIICDLLLGKILGMQFFFQRSYSDETIHLIEENAKYIYEKEIKIDKTRPTPEKIPYLPLYHFLIEKSERHYTRTQNYVALYGVLRNSSFVALIICWLMIFNLNEFLNDKWILIFITILISFICFLGYIKFFRNLTEEVYFGVISTKQNSNSHD